MKLSIKAITIATNTEYGPFAVILEIPPNIPKKKRLEEIHHAILDQLGKFRDEVEILHTYSAEADGNVCRVIVPVNLFAIWDTIHKMLLLQWIAKRLAEYAPPINVTWTIHMKTLIGQ